MTATTINDNCTATSDLTISQIPIAGTSLTGHNMTQIITVTATDNSGNSNQCNFQVSVEDQSPPSLTCPPNQNVVVDSTCTTVSYTHLTLPTIYSV